MKPKIVTLGSGSGQRKLLEGLSPEQCDVTAIVGVTDNGGSSAVLRRSMNIPQPGDTRSCLTAVARDEVLRKLLDFRFQEGELRGVNLGNYILAALTRIEGDFGLAVERAGELVSAWGRVLPATVESTHVCAELVNGARLVGEWEIIRRKPRARILRVSLEKPVPVYPPAAEAIANADLVVIGPGSLMTGIVPVLLAKGLREAIQRSSAPVAYVTNLMTQPGQTDGFSVRDHVEVVETYLKLSVDHVLANDADVPGELLAHFRTLGSEPVADNMGDDARMVRGNLLQADSLETLRRHDRPDNVFFLYHDPSKLAERLLGTIA